MSRDVDVDVALQRFEGVRAARQQFAVKEHEPDAVFGDHFRGTNARQLDVAVSGNTRADHPAANVIDADVAALGLDVHGRINRNLDGEVDIADHAPAIVADDIYPKTVRSLFWSELCVGREELRLNRNLALLPGFDRDRAGDVLDFETNVFLRGIFSRDGLLSESADRDGMNDDGTGDHYQDGARREIQRARAGRAFVHLLVTNSSELTLQVRASFCT